MDPTFYFGIDEQLPGKQSISEQSLSFYLLSGSKALHPDYRH